MISAALLSFANYNAQEGQDKFWSVSNETTIRLAGKRQIVPQKYLTFRLNGSGLKDKLFSAPLEKQVLINQSTCVITLPLPNGSIQQFKVVESPIMEPGLAKQFPDIKTFSIKGIDDPYANGKMDWNEFGFHVMVRTANGDFFIDPYCVGNTADYITYYTTDFVKDPSQRLPEVGVIQNPDKTQKPTDPKKKEGNGAKINSVSQSVPSGAQLRTYRLAVACTGEYAVAATGLGAPSVAQTLAKIVTSVNRVDGVYESEVGVRLVLVATETMVVFTNAITDPFSGNNNANVLINESQTIITNTIGSANYDIGHTFSTGGGGLANLGVVCIDPQKASGITGDPSPVGDPYDIDYVAHEMGHQFSGNHPFNSVTSSCGGGNRNASTAVEPGSGITIMAYAGICGSDDLAGNSIAYFHAVSYDEIIAFINGPVGNFCPVTTATGNQPPVVTGSGNYTIPKSTAFILKGSAIDPDGDSLTYSWEETDPGPTGGSWNSTNAPYFRSYSPSLLRSRSFPKFSVVATGNYTGTKGEYAPPYAQTLNFRLTARDNKPGGGGVDYADNIVTVASSGPFKLTYPNAPAITWYLNGQEGITWNVNGSDSIPVSCDTVRVLISYNSGVTYSVLLNSTPNDGVQIIPVPTVTAQINTCRIKIEGKGNIFYDISDNNFTIANVVAGIRKISQNNPVGLTVWPNPFNSEFNLAATKLNSSSVTVIKIVDVLGKIILTNNYLNKSELRETINLSEINPGIYFISVTNDNMHSVYRIIKN